MLLYIKEGKIIFYTFLSLFAIVSIFLALVVYLKNRKNKANLIFGLMCLCIAFWVLTTLMAGLSKEIVGARFWVSLTILGPIIFFYLLFRFSQNFFYHKQLQLNRNYKNLLLFLPTIILVLLVFTNANIRSASFSQAGLLHVHPGFLYPLFFIYFLIYTLTSYRNFFISYKKSTGAVRSQLKYLLVGLTLTFTAAVLTNVILIIFNNNDLARYGPLSTIFFIAFTSYAILAHHLFDIRVILTEISTISVVLALIIQLTTSDNKKYFGLNVVILLVVTYGGYLLVKSVRQEIDRREEIEKLAKEREIALKEVDERNRNLLTLQKFSDIVLDNEELKPMIREIINTIPKEIPECSTAVVILANQEEKVLKGYCASKNLDGDVSHKWEKYIGDYQMVFGKGDDLIMGAYQHQCMQRDNHLSDFLCPPLEKQIAKELQEKSGIKGIIAMPLAAKDEKFGVLVFGMKRAVEDIDQDVLSMITAIAGEVSLAVQRAMAYENLKKANDYLEELDRMKDEFISVASHEMNTPLAAIQGYLSMILDEGMGKVDATAKEYLSRVYASSKRLAALILDLLNVSRIEQGRVHLMYAETRPEELVKSVMDELVVRSDAKKLYLRFAKPDEQLPTTWVDLNRIREVLVNMVGNSIKFTDKGGVEIKAETEGEMLKFTVHDTGVGVPEEEVDKLFKKFSQLNREKNEFQGSGLGLYISKSIVELHGGKMWVVATPKGETGATFCFTVPILTEKPEDPFEGEGAVLQTTKGESSEVEKQARETVGAGRQAKG